MRTVIIAGGNLFRIALEQLGDATQWNRIAALNNVDDPVVTGVRTLGIPEVNRASGGGFEP